jgi:hypothetical protein
LKRELGFVEVGLGFRQEDRCLGLIGVQSVRGDGRVDLRVLYLSMDAGTKFFQDLLVVAGSESYLNWVRSETDK